MFAPLRNKLFWLLDEARGAKIKKQLREVSSINDFPFSDTSVSLRKKYLHQILQHCLDTVPFYREMDIEDLSLQKFPVLNKNAIRERQDRFLSDQYKKKRLYKASTSGSTGTPFTVLQDGRKRRRNSSDTLYFARKANYSLGAPLYFMRIWKGNDPGGHIRRFLQNVHQVDVTKLDDKKLRQLQDRLLRGNQNKSMLAYASAYESICDYLDRNNPFYSTNKVKSIISMSETLPAHCSASLKKYFNCEAFARYSNRENGILAQQVPGLGENYLINMASYHIEILELDSDKVAGEGTIGRIVVTDFFNFSMPLIRYDTGDIGIRKRYHYKGREFSIFSRIEGRRMDSVYNTSGQLLSSFIFPNRLRKYENIKQFQFVQFAPRSYKFILNASPQFSKEEKLIREFSGLLGENAKLEIEYVEDIPLLSSGKRKKVLNTYRSV
ncbi:MAG: CoF synthetase [Flavobacteriaceae bacterium]